jgi:monofunctional biosynthetic peptidoglycan transglycosylase
VSAKVVGGSSITQQLAKILFLGSERSWARKGQEFAINFMLGEPD